MMLTYALVKLRNWILMPYLWLMAKSWEVTSDPRAKLFIDDERFPPRQHKDADIVRSYVDFLAYITRNGCPRFISFDHDLGENSLSGMDIAKYMVERDLDCGGKFIPEGFSYTVHSMNPIGASNIDCLLSSYLEWRGY